MIFLCTNDNSVGTLMMFPHSYVFLFTIYLYNVCAPFLASLLKGKEAGIRSLVGLDDQGGEAQCPSLPIPLVFVATES